MADNEFGRSRAFLGRTDTIDPLRLNNVLRVLEAEVVATLAADDRPQVRRSASMRYSGQAFELTVALPAHDLAAPDLAALAEAFEAEHEKSYGHRLTDATGIETVAVEVVASTRPWDGRPPIPLPPRGAAPAVTERHGYFGPEAGLLPVTVLPRRSMLQKNLPGPLIIEEYEGTTVVPPGASASLDQHANIVIVLADTPR